MSATKRKTGLTEVRAGILYIYIYMIFFFKSKCDRWGCNALTKDGEIWKNNFETLRMQEAERALSLHLPLEVDRLAPAVSLFSNKNALLSLEPEPAVAWVLTCALVSTLALALGMLGLRLPDM